MEDLAGFYQNKIFVVDWDKVQTLDDVKTVLKGLQVTIHIVNVEYAQEFKELFDRGLLIEKSSIT